MAADAREGIRAVAQRLDTVVEDGEGQLGCIDLEIVALDVSGHLPCFAFLDMDLLHTAVGENVTSGIANVFRNSVVQKCLAYLKDNTVFGSAHDSSGPSCHLRQDADNSVGYCGFARTLEFCEKCVAPRAHSCTRQGNWLLLRAKITEICPVDTHPERHELQQLFSKMRKASRLQRGLALGDRQAGLVFRAKKADNRGRLPVQDLPLALPGERDWMDFGRNCTKEIC